jgi:hypothetical protein
VLLLLVVAVGPPRQWHLLCLKPAAAAAVDAAADVQATNIGGITLAGPPKAARSVKYECLCWLGEGRCCPEPVFPRPSVVG